jgi:hypothetical protein
MNALFDKYLHLIASAPAESLLYLEHAPAAQSGATAADCIGDGSDVRIHYKIT